MIVEFLQCVRDMILTIQVSFRWRYPRVDRPEG
mgnify:CR=1 FL=1